MVARLELHSFLFLFKGEYYSIGYACCVLDIHLSVDGYLGGFYVLAVVNSAAGKSSVRVSACVPPFFCACLDVELLDHLVSFCLTS